MPMPLYLGQDRYRIFFGSRTVNNQPSISYVEIDIKSPYDILKISEEPVLKPGKLGYFDSNGLYPGNFIHIDNKLLMYYMGRSNGEKGMYYMAVGLAISHDYGLTFERVSEAPIMERSAYDPWMVTTPWVMKENGKWNMWYTSGIGWSDDGRTSYYHIKKATSNDGINWNQINRVAIPLEKNETNVAAPTVSKVGSNYEMWFSYVSSAAPSYQLGYAKSKNGEDWTRHPIEPALRLSSQGWDSTCMAYPSSFKHKGKQYLLYSGNDLGKAGFGLAVCDV